MQVYGFCIRTLRLPVISVMIIGVMRLSYNERAVPDGDFGTICSKLCSCERPILQDNVFFWWSRVYTAVESDVTAPVGM